MEQLIPALFIGGTVYLLGNAYLNTTASASNSSPLPAPAIHHVTGYEPAIIERALEGRIVHNSSNILEPEQAYRLLQAGRYSEVLPQHISDYFTYEEVFVSSEFFNKKNLKRVSLSVLKNAKKHAEQLDRLRVAFNRPIKIVSWIRLSSSTTHGQGLGTDIDGSYNLKRELDAVATRMGWRGGQGLSDGSGGVPKLHLDSGRERLGWWYNASGKDYGQRTV